MVRQRDKSETHRQLGLGCDFETAEPYLQLQIFSNKAEPPPTRLYLLIFPKEFHQLGPIYSNLSCYNGHCYSNYHSIHPEKPILCFRKHSKDKTFVLVSRKLCMLSLLNRSSFYQVTTKGESKKEICFDLN